MKNLIRGSLLALILLAGCNYHVDKVGEQKEGLQSVPDSAVIDYAFVNAKVLDPKCLNCHSTKGRGTEPILETYAQVRAHLASIDDEVKTNRMPFRRAPLSAQEKELLAVWIAAGAPEVVVAKPVPEPAPVPPPEEPTPAPPPAPEPPPEPPPLVLDYETVRKNVIEPSCIKCHSTAHPKGGVNLDSYQGILKDLADVQSDIELDIMPLRSVLTPAQKTLILDWIKTGAPETALPPATQAQCDESKLTRAFVKFVIQDLGDENRGAADPDECASMGKKR